MMATTHAAAGVCLVVPLLALSPDLAVPAALGTMLGGVVPDLDLFVGTHRRTLHYPMLGWLPAALAVGAADLAPTPGSVAVAALSAPGVVLFDGPVRWLLVVGLVVSLGYAGTRKRMPAWMR